MEENYYALFLCIINPNYTVSDCLRRLGVIPIKSVAEKVEPEELSRLRETGLSYKKIGRQFGMCDSTAKYLIEKWRKESGYYRSTE